MTVHDAICPSWETLSCYADAELPASEAAIVSAHLTQCRRCVAVVDRLSAPLAAPVTQQHDGDPHCPSTETLLAYLESVQPHRDDDALVVHVVQCDGCVGRLAILARQVELEDLAAVPAAVVAQATAAAGRIDWVAATLRPMRRRPPVWLRLPVLMPLAFAAGVCAFVATQQLQGIGAGSGERWRAVQAPPVAQRAFASDATLRSAAHSSANAVAEVRRGTTVTVIAERADWLEVVLADGRRGWAPRNVFE